MNPRIRHVLAIMVVAVSLPASAGIFYSNLNNIVIATDFDGVYLDVDGNVWGSSEAAVTGWDINPFFGGVGVATSLTFQPARAGTGNLDVIVNYAEGATIDDSSKFATGYGGSLGHLAPSAGSNKFIVDTDGYLGFKLSNGGGGWNYGWMRVVFNGAGTSAMIKDWAYDTSGAPIVVGCVKQGVPVNLTQLVTLSPGSGKDFTLSSAITDTNGNVNRVVKSGLGTATLTGDNSHTGTTTVSEGHLLVNGLLSGAGMVSVAYGATLGGTGSISGPVNVSGVLSPGASVETFYSGTLIMNDGAGIHYEVDSSVDLGLGSDLQRVVGNLSMNGVVILDLTDVASSPLAFPVNTRFSLINYTGSWNSGVFTYGSLALANGAVFNAGLNTWQITYNATSGGSNFSGEYLNGNFVNLTAVPETGVVLLAGLGLLTLLRRRR